jgi:hypothetical protein
LAKRIKDDQYILSDRARSDIRYFAKDFRDQALFNLTNFEKSQSNEKTLDELVKAFGVYAVYCFIEALKPTPSDDSKLSLDWVKDVLLPFKMYLSFISTFRSGKHKKQREPSPNFDQESIEILTRALKKSILYSINSCSNQKQVV